MRETTLVPIRNFVWGHDSRDTRWRSYSLKNPVDCKLTVRLHASVSDKDLRLLHMKFLSLSLLVFLLATPLNAQQWHPLFDGQSFDGWTSQNGDPVDPESTEAWEVEGGMLHLDRTKGKGGNLLTEREFGDFELVFEWKVAPKANNGIKYRVKDFDGRVLGMEYQVIDDFGNPKLKPKHKTASIYDIYDAKEHALLQPADMWNRGRVLVKNDHVQHWLNGQLIAEAKIGSEDWDQHLAQSKFADVPGFGRNHFGRIMLTDHKDEVWYRNIFIREFPSVSAQDVGCSDVVAASSRGNQSAASASACCCQPTAARRRLFRRRRR